MCTQKQTLLAPFMLIFLLITMEKKKIARVGPHIGFLHTRELKVEAGTAFVFGLPRVNFILG